MMYLKNAIVPLSGLPSLKSAKFTFFWIVFLSSINPIFEASIDEDIFLPMSPGRKGTISSIRFLYPSFGSCSRARTKIFLWSIAPICMSTFRYCSSRACISG